MKSNELRLQLLDYYERNGIDVAAMPKGNRWRDRQDCHWPIPECLGGTETTPLLKDGHILMDLLVSEEVQHRSFFPADVLKLLKMLPDELDSEVTMMFWALYKKWVGANERGKAVYKDPVTGATAMLTKEEAEERGWAHNNKGKSNYTDPATGSITRLTKEEAEERGWVHASKGKAPYKNPETGATECLTREEADERGWVGISGGKANYRDPCTGELVRLTKAEAERRGWVGQMAGLSVYRDPTTGATAMLTNEEAEERGWVGINAGKNVYRDPHTGERASLTKEEAEERGWVHNNLGRTLEKSVCPHCGREADPGNFKQFHGDNCVEREGSERWFREQMRLLDPTWKQRPNGQWRRVKGGAK